MYDDPHSDVDPNLRYFLSDDSEFWIQFIANHRRRRSDGSVPLLTIFVLSEKPLTRNFRQEIENLYALKESEENVDVHVYKVSTAPKTGPGLIPSKECIDKLLSKDCRWLDPPDLLYGITVTAEHKTVREFSEVPSPVPVKLIYDDIYKRLQDIDYSMK
jgi:hypothetical protein